MPDQSDTDTAGEDAENFQPSDLPQCGAARCPEVAEFFVEWGVMDEPVEELRCSEHTEADTVTIDREIPESERRIPNVASGEPEAICLVADTLTEGDKVLFNDRVQELEVAGRHEKPITKTHRQRGTTRDYYDIVELAGNGTEYHLLWKHGSGGGPILRKRSQWTETETGDGTEYDYNHSGERIERIEILQDTHE